MKLGAGKQLSRVVEHDGHYAVMGVCVSSGYREFKASDGYKEEVLAIVFDPIGPVRERAASAAHVNTAIQQESLAGEHTEYATFISDGVLFALPAAHVLEAVSSARLTTIPSGADKSRIGLLNMQHKGEHAKPVWVFDLNRLLKRSGASPSNESQIIVVENSGRRLGLLVDELHDVKEFSTRQVMHSPFFSEQDQTLVRQLIKANQGSLLIQSICVNTLFTNAVGAESGAVRA